MPSTAPPLIIDLGSSECRIALAGATAPICVDPCVVKRTRSGASTTFASSSTAHSSSSLKSRSPFDPVTGLLVNFDVLEEILDTGLLRLGVTEPSQRVVVTEHMCSPGASRIAVLEMLHETYGAEEIATGIDALFAMQTLLPREPCNGLATPSSSAVLSISHSSTIVLPLTATTYPDFSHASRCPVGMLELGRHMQLLLHAKYCDAPFFASEAFSLDCVRKYCYVAKHYNEAVRRHVLPRRKGAAEDKYAASYIDMQVPYAALHPALPPGAERVKLTPSEDEQYKRDPVAFMTEIARERRVLSGYGADGGGLGKGVIGSSGLGGTGSRILIGSGSGSSSERRRAEAQHRMRQITSFLDASDETKRTAEELDEEVWQWDQANQPQQRTKEDEANAARMTRLDQILSEYDPHGYFRRIDATTSKNSRSLAKSMMYGDTEPTTLEQVDSQLSAILLTTERVRVAEALFAPSLLGLECAGAAELLAGRDTVYIVGGGSQIPGLSERLELELAPYASHKPRIIVADTHTPATQGAWHGASQVALEHAKDLVWSSRANFLEIGGERALALLRRSHPWANS